MKYVWTFVVIKLLAERGIVIVAELLLKTS